MAEAVTPPNPANGETRSVPDPTLLTIDALRREIAMLDGQTKESLTAVKALTAERFRSVDALMERAEEMRREQKADTKLAVDAALDSQKEATAKMERSISDQISSLRINFETEARSIRGSIEDLKEGMARLESVRIGHSEQKSESRQISAGVIALIGIGITILLAILTVIGFATAQGM